MLAQSAAWWAYWPYYILAVVLAAASLTDVRQGRIPNWITYPGVLAGLLGHTLVGGLTGRGPLALGLGGSAAGLAVGFLPLMAAWLAGGIGGGDAKAMGAVGALTGWRFTLAAMLYGFVVAAIMALIVMIRKKTTRQTLGRVWRFLVLIFTPGPAVDPATKGSAKIPFGLALCIGAALALIEALWRGPVANKLLLGW
jgi:prepilin peptidase CpaA